MTLIIIILIIMLRIFFKVGRGKHCTPEKREMIQKLINEGKTYKTVQQLVGCSAKMIANVKKYHEKQETRGRKPVLSPRMVKRMVRYSKAQPMAPATQIRDELNLPSSVITVRRRLKEHNLSAHSPRKVPLLKKIHVIKRLRFAKQHLTWPIEKWRNILWTDESKIVLYGGTGSRQYVRRPSNTEYNPRFT